MRNLLLFLSLLCMAILLLNGCNRGEEEIVRLQSQVDSLVAQAKAKDQTINEFFESLNQIERNLSLIKEKEKKIGSNIQLNTPTEIADDDRERISQDIIEINEIMAKNRATISELNAKLKKSNLKIAQFEKMLAAAKRKIEERDSIITELKDNLGNLNLRVDSLNVAMNTLDSTNRQLSDQVSKQHAALDEAWYAFGSKKELKENNVISSTGGFLGIGKNNELKEDFDSSYFTRISIEGTDEIELFATKKGVELITSHPTASYELVKNDQGDVVKLRILDKAQFWRSSRYLVVLIK